MSTLTISNGSTSSNFDVPGTLELFYQARFGTNSALRDWFQPLLNVIDDTSYNVTPFIGIDLGMSFDNPVELELQGSYDNSVNMLFVDGSISDKIVNSRFIVNGTNVIPGNRGNTTNLYLNSAIKTQTNLVKYSVNYMTVDLTSVNNVGNTKAGNYIFYFKYSNEEGADTNFVGESGLVSIFNGSMDSSGDVSSVYGGILDEVCTKSITFTLSNLDPSFSKIKVYVARESGDINSSTSVSSYYYLTDLFSYDNSNVALTTTITIFGNENSTTIDVSEILATTDNKSSKTLTQCQNILFKGNLASSSISTATALELQNLATFILPEVVQGDSIGFVDETYNDKSSLNLNQKGEYYNPQNIYYRLGYWNEDYYRFGVVFNVGGELSQVFNIRGGVLLGTTGGVSNTPFTSYDPTTINLTGYLPNSYVDINGFFTSYNSSSNTGGNTTIYENINGLCYLNSSNPLVYEGSTKSVVPYGIQLTLSPQLLTKLTSLGVTGMFVVRQDRIPNILAQGLTIGLNQQSNTPTVPVREIYGINADQTTSYLHETICNRSLVLDVPKSGVVNNYGANGEWCTKVDDYSDHYSAGIIAITNGLTPSLGYSRIYKPLQGLGGDHQFYYWYYGNSSNQFFNSYSLIDNLDQSNLKLGIWDYLGYFCKIIKADQKRYTVYLVYENDGDSQGTKTDIVECFYSPNIQNRVIVSPDIQLNQIDYANLFTGSQSYVKSNNTLNINWLDFVQTPNRICYPDSFTSGSSGILSTNLIYVNSNGLIIPNTNSSINLNDPLGGIDNITNPSITFRNTHGNAEEDLKNLNNRYLRPKLAGHRVTDYHATQSSGGFKILFNSELNNFLSIGNFPNYLGSSNLLPDGIVNILNSNQIYSSLLGHTTTSNSAVMNEFKSRIQDNPYFTIGQYVPLSNSTTSFSKTFYKGDCFIVNYAQRMIYNLNGDNLKGTIASSTKNTFKDAFRYDGTNEGNNDGNFRFFGSNTSLPTNFVETSQVNMPQFESSNYNQADLGYVKLGHWLNIKCCSSFNGNIRCLDASVAGSAIKDFYPHKAISSLINYDTMESFAYNKSYGKYPSAMVYSTSIDVSEDNNSNRIVYSDVMSPNSLVNNYCVFESQNYKDYLNSFGQITKIVEFRSHIICVFERGVCIIPVNERAVASESTGGTVYINTSNVLPDNPKILSNSYGSTWIHSVIKTPNFVYGFDTVAKRIWRTDGEKFEIISDLKVNEFITNNTSIQNLFSFGQTNVKTHYNEFKKDVMFTWYDLEANNTRMENNLCYNEALNVFTSYYTWTPLLSENSGNKYISFDLDKLIINSTFIESLEFWLHGTNKRFNTLVPIAPTTWYSDYAQVGTAVFGENDVYYSSSSPLVATSYVAGKVNQWYYEFIVIGVPGIHKIFNNLQIISNKNAPQDFQFEVCGEVYSFNEFKSLIEMIQNRSDSDLLVPTKAGEQSLLTILTNNNLLNKGLPYISVISNETPPIVNTNTSQTLLVDYTKLNEIRVRNYQKGLDIKQYGRIRGNMQYLEDIWDVEIRPISFVKKYVDNGTIKTTPKEETKIRDKYLKVRVIYSGTDLNIISAIRTLFTISYS